jgi:hypothetical protein
MEQKTETTEAELRALLESEHGKVWSTEQLRQEFEVLGFCAPWCTVIRKADRVKGTVEFCHQPRFYYGFIADDKA